MRNARTLPQMNLRLPEDLKEVIRQQAEQNNRSLNSEAVFALQQYYKQQAQPQNAQLETTT